MVKGTYSQYIARAADIVMSALPQTVAAVQYPAWSRPVPRAESRQGKSFKTCAQCGRMANSNRQRECIECRASTKWSAPVRKAPLKRRLAKKRKKTQSTAFMLAKIERLKKKQRVERVKRSLAVCV
jgi:hypothetical protein